MGHVSEMCTTPQQILSLPFDLNDVVKISGGGGHTLILNKVGQLFACGWNHKGQLGVNNVIDTLLIVAIPEFNASIVDIACGWDSSAAIDTHGNLFVWGSNFFGQLGFKNTSISFLTVPTELKLPFNRKVKQVCFGLQFMCILCEDNEIFVVGRFKYSNDFQLTAYNNIEFYKISMARDRPIDHISCGSKHIVCATQTSIIAYGDNRFNQCKSLELSNRVKCLDSGWTHSGALTEDGNIFLWGRNTYGQLADVNVADNEIKLLPCDGFVKELHLGSEHGLAVTDDGSVFTWGWNEHGNCGNGNELNQ